MVLLASQTITSATNRPVETSINQLLSEYEFTSAKKLSGLIHIKNVLEEFGIISIPPIEDADFKAPIVLQPKLSGEKALQKVKGLLDQDGETFTLELKSSIRICRDKQKHAPGKPINEYVKQDLEYQLAREISAFANKNGGDIICGVAEIAEEDGGGLNILGCQDDINSFTKGSGKSDKIDLILNQLIEKYFLEASIARQYIQFELVIYQDKPLLLISVAASKKLIFLRENINKNNQLNIRQGTSAQSVKFSDIENYYTLKRISS
ncbi:ATP-binding protein [Emcibacteraceae bacterium]|nr:ATP-binding protein [Emcibacteraceae bacterium]